MSEETNAPLVFVAAASAELPRGQSFVAIVRTRDELERWLREPPRGVQWLQVEGLLGDPDAWAFAAQGASALPLDVIVEHPVGEFSDLYRLVDVRLVRDVRVTMPATPGFLKALRLAASLQLPVRLLPGQPTDEILDELTEAAEFYLHHELVDAPIEFFHSFLAILAGPAGSGTGSAGVTAALWKMLEQEPALFPQLDTSGHPRRPADFVATHLRTLLQRQAECATCEWQEICAGYFKQPDPTYSCTGIRRLLARLAAAAEEIHRDLAAGATSQDVSVSGATPPSPAASVNHIVASP